VDRPRRAAATASGILPGAGTSAMPKDESLQHKLDRVRPPRVQITYDVEIGDAEVKKELPFVLGVMSDLSGHPDPDNPLKPLVERDFVEINRDNFDRVMAGVRPRLEVNVENRLQDDGSKLGMTLNFRSIEDFEPEHVINQVEPLRKLLEVRRRLSDLKAKVVSNARLDGLLQEIIHDTEKLKRLGSEVGRTDEAPAPSEEA
jgi:type VI secretion system protein ImpB